MYVLTASVLLALGAHGVESSVQRFPGRALSLWRRDLGWYSELFGAKAVDLLNFVLGVRIAMLYQSMLYHSMLYHSMLYRFIL